jgi:hypothetical protein
MQYNKIDWMAGQKKLKSHIYLCVCTFMSVGVSGWCAFIIKAVFTLVVLKKGLKSVLYATPNVKTIVVLIYDSYGFVLRN